MPGQQTSADFQRTSAVYFVAQFTDSIRVLQEVLGITRTIEKVPGQVIKTYKVTGTLEDGTVAEGATIPLSKYKTEVADIFELTVKKWRKQTTLEAINDKGYEQAVEDTDAQMVLDIQSGMRSDFFAFLPTGTGTATGKGLQGALAQTWGQLQVKYENKNADGYLYFVNILDIADYLADAKIEAQTAFGMTYIKGFLGIYDLVAYSDVPRGKVIGTAKKNVILYYTNPKNSELSKAFDFVTDKTGYVGVHHDTTYNNLTNETVAICGMKLFAELIDGIVIGTIEPADSGTEG